MFNNNVNISVLDWYLVGSGSGFKNIGSDLTHRRKKTVFKLI
jgi:hypothetical protein